MQGGGNVIRYMKLILLLNRQVEQNITTNNSIIRGHRFHYGIIY